MTFLKYKSIKSQNLTREIAESIRITRAFRDVLQVILTTVDQFQSDAVFKCLDRLAYEAGCSRRTVQRAIEHFQFHGILDKQARFTRCGGMVRQLSNVYRVTKSLAIRLITTKHTIKHKCISLEQIRKCPKLIKYNPNTEEADFWMWILYNQETGKTYKMSADKWQAWFDNRPPSLRMGVV